MFGKSIRVLLLSLGAFAVPGAAGAADLITVGTISDPGYDSALWALANGKVRDPAIEVKITAVPIPAMLQAAMTRQYNILPNGILGVAQLAEQGIPARIVGTQIRYNPKGRSADVWVKKDSPYKTIRDLKGKTIAVVAFEAQNVVSVRAVIAERYGMNAAVVGGDFRWVAMPPAQYEAALLADRVDAVNFSNVPAYTATKGGAYRSVLHGSQELQEMYGGPMASVITQAYQEELDKRPEVYVAFLKLMKASAAYALANQNEVFGAVAPKYKMDPEDLKTWFTTFAVMPYALGPTDKQVFRKSWESGHKLGVLKKVPDSVDSLVWSKAVTE